MGYTTSFNGSFNVSPALKPEHRDYLMKFNNTRRMTRDAAKAELLPDPLRIAAGLPIGEEACNYVGSTAPHGQDESIYGDPNSIILDYNQAPGDQPGLWCQWIPTEDGAEIVWDEGEKFYDYVGWAKYLVEHFLSPWGYQLDGEVFWQGEDDEDFGKIKIVASQVKAIAGLKTYPEEPEALPIWDGKAVAGGTFERGE